MGTAPHTLELSPAQDGTGHLTQFSKTWPVRYTGSLNSCAVDQYHLNMAIAILVGYIYSSLFVPLQENVTHSRQSDAIYH